MLKLGLNSYFFHRLNKNVLYKLHKITIDKMKCFKIIIEIKRRNSNIFKSIINNKQIIIIPIN